LRQEFFQADGLSAKGADFICRAGRTIGDDFHLKSLCPFAYRFGDVAKANDAQGFLVELSAHQSLSSAIRQPLILYLLLESHGSG